MNIDRMVDLIVCQDCIMIIANDDGSGIEDEQEHRERIELGVFRLGGGYLGIGNTERTDGYGFTTSGCDLCLDPCHGDMFPAHLDRSQVTYGAELTHGTAYSSRTDIRVILPGIGDELGNVTLPQLGRGTAPERVRRAIEKEIRATRMANYGRNLRWHPWPQHDPAVTVWWAGSPGEYRVSVYCDAAHQCGRMVCPECGERVTRRGVMFRDGWALSGPQGERLMWQHTDESPLCPTIISSGYAPSLPVRLGEFTKVAS